MFEYLMPLLVMRSYPGTLLEESCRSVVRRQRDYGRERGVPWGISESAYDLIDHHDNYQYKAFGVPGLGLKRGLGDDLVVAPYAIALAALVDPGAAVSNLRRLEAKGLQGAFGFFDAVDFTARGPDEPGVLAAGGRAAAGVVVRSYLAHHQGMTLVAMANALQGNRMVGRFHADPRVRATELLLQERAPRHAPFARPRPDEAKTRTAPVPAAALRRFRSAHTPHPHAQFLSNGNYISVVTNAGGGASFCRGRAVTRSRLDSTCDPGSQFLYLRDVRSGRVWSATQHPIATEAEDYLVTFAMERATFHRREDEIGTQLDIAVSPEDDVEVRRLVVTNHGDRVREIEVTSYAEMVLAPAADDLAHPAFGKLFLESEAVPGGAALLCHRRPRAPDDAPAWGLHVLSQEGRTQGPVEWEGDRASFLGRGRRRRRPAGARREIPLRHHGRPARSHHEPPAAHPARPRWRGPDVVRHRDVGQPGDCAGPRPAVPRPERNGPDLRARLGACPEHAPASRDHGRGGHPLRPPGLPRPPGRCVAPGPPGAPGQEHPRPGGALAARHLRGRPHRAGPGRRGGRARAGAPGPPGAGVLEAEGAPGRRRRAERAPRQLPRPRPRCALRAARRRILAGVEAPAGRGLPAAPGPDARGRADPALDGRQGDPQRRAGRTGAANRSARPPLDRATGAGAPSGSDSPALAVRARAGPPAGPRQRDRGLRRPRPRIRRGPRGCRGDPFSLGERHRQSRLRNHRHGLRVGLHLVHEQPREPAHALRQRPGLRPHLGGPLRPRRGHGRGLDAHAGAAPEARRGRAPRRPPRGRRHPVRARRERHPARARGVRRRRQSGEVLRPHADERGSGSAATGRVRVRRVGAGATAGGAADARGHAE